MNELAEDKLARPLMPQLEQSHRSALQASELSNEALRRCVRDLIALSTLPAVWAGSDAPQIAERLAEALARILPVEFVYFRFRNSPPLEVAWSTQKLPPSEVEKLSRILDLWLNSEVHQALPVDVGDLDSTRLSITPVGSQAELGIIACGSKVPLFPNEIEKAFLNVAATQAAVSLKAVNELSEKKKAEKSLADKARQQVALYEFVAQLHRANSLEDVYESALHAIEHALSCERASLLLFDEQSIMRFVAWHDLSATYRTTVEGHTPWSRMDTNATPIVIPDVKSAEIESHLKPAIIAEGIQALAFIPLISEGELIGKFMAYYNVPHEFTQAELELSVSIARQLTLTVEKKKSDEALRESEARFRVMADSSPVPIWVNDKHGELLFVNRAYRDLFGIALDEIQRTGWEALIHPDDLPSYSAAFRQALKARQRFQRQCRVRNAKGEWRWIESVSEPRISTTGDFLGMVGSCPDITDLKEATQFLEHAVAQRTESLREAIAQMEEFSYTVSHDLRAPLRAICSYADALLEDYTLDLDENAKEYLQQIRQGAERMDRLSRDVLAFSRVARSDVALVPVRLERLVRDIFFHYIKVQYPAAEITIESPLRDVLAQDVLLGQCISNLLTNAVKFVAKGVSPRVRIYTEESNSKVRIWVEDNGIGIPAQYQSRLFKIFERLHPDREYEGTGIGLAIVRKAIVKMGGNCGVESDGVHGSRFWVELFGSAGNVQEC